MRRERYWIAGLFTLAVLGFGCGENPCRPGETLCQDSCVETSSTPQHCGGCGIVCGGGEVCSAGRCVGEAPQCPTGQAQCSGACVDTRTNAQHCGGCGNTCGEGKGCTEGSCQATCPAGQSPCGGTCVNTSSDPRHCGACGTTCQSGKTCSDGSCVLVCAAGQSECGGACVDTSASPQHCGSCGNVCSSGEQCLAGTCTLPCPAGQTRCEGACVDTASNTNHCGSCGNACLSGTACVSGACGGCIPGLTRCGTTCVDSASDTSNCGACARACGQGESCIQSVCKAPTSCSSALIEAKADAWGNSWDGLERVSANYATAKQTCERFGARLPTASELFRVNATQQGGLGSSSANYLWALTPDSPTAQFTLRLSDGSTASRANDTATKSNYRCICAAATPAFTGNACLGPSGSACFALNGQGGRYNIDARDRPRLSKSGATWECAFYRAHLADYVEYVDGILNGLPNGSGTWLHTGDDARTAAGTVLRWTGTNRTWLADGNTSAVSMATLLPFRCAGPRVASGTHPNTVANEYVGPLGGYKGEKTEPAQGSWVQAHDTCWNRGGHLPSAGELAELIQQGLPNGSDLWLWSSEQAGYYAPDLRAMLVKWTGVAPSFGYSYPNFVTSGAKATAQYPFRCIYYPIDTQYTGPATSACQGGCTRFQLPGAQPAVMWMDNQDRTTSTLASAIGGCAAQGGRLASARDYTEAIRHGLPNGSGVWVSTSDISYDDAATTPIARRIVLRWSAINRDFTEQYSTYATWSTMPTASPYRCVWTNELR